MPLLLDQASSLCRIDPKFGIGDLRAEMLSLVEVLEIMRLGGRANDPADPRAWWRVGDVRVRWSWTWRGLGSLLDGGECGS